MLLIHGKTGNELVMWIFTQKLPPNYWLLAPRAPVELEPGSYAWVPESDHLSRYHELQQPARNLKVAYEQWTLETGAPSESVDVMGFSQGAAMAYTLAAEYPQWVNRVIALAGFLPSVEAMPGPYAALRGKRIYIAHGARDETIPVENAQTAARELNQVGADVTYCESDVGHKMSADCLRGLAEFMRKLY
jgi:phospholipase/carboxylesterase